MWDAARGCAVAKVVYTLPRPLTCAIPIYDMRSLGFGRLILAFLAMAYLGPAIAVAAHMIASGGFLSSRRTLSWSERVWGVLEAVVVGLLWLPTLVLLLIRAAIGR